MKAVLISIQPYWVFLIIARLMGWDIPQEKTVEVRKDFPKDSAWNRKTLIYCSKSMRSFRRIPAQYQPFMKKLLGKVIGEFVCDDIEDILCTTNGFPEGLQEAWYRECNGSCLTTIDFMMYGKGKLLYGWHISDLKIYDKPKPLGAFYSYPKRLDSDFCNHCPHHTKHPMDFPCCDCLDDNGDRKYLTRPPQSWCYVEEV